MTAGSNDAPARGKASLRGRALFAVKAAVSVGLMYWVVRSALAHDGVDALGASLSRVSLVWVAAAVGLQSLPIVTGTLRWGLLLRAQGIRLAFPWLLRSYLVGRFIGAFTPSTTGLDFYRAWDVARETGDMGKSAGAVLVEKGLGLLAVAMVCLALFPFGARELLGTGAFVVAGAAAIGSVIGVAILARPAQSKVLLRVLPRVLRARAEKLLDAVSAPGLGASVLGRGIALGLFAHLSLSSVFAATGVALGVDVPLDTLLVVGNAIVIATLLPISIGGVGVREGVAVLLLSRIGVSVTDATLVALLGYLAGQVPALAGGVLLLLRRPATPRPTPNPAPTSSP